MLDSLNKFFSNLSATKLFIASILIIAAFWYLNIFLFDRQLITDEKFQIPLIISFCLSFTWNMVTTVFSLTFFKKPPQPRLYPEQEQIADLDWAHKSLFWNIFASVILLSIATLLELFFQAKFKTYILISFLLLVLLTWALSYLMSKQLKQPSNHL